MQSVLKAQKPFFLSVREKCTFAKARAVHAKNGTNKLENKN